MGAGLLIGGAPPLVLRADGGPAAGPTFVEAVVLPGRGMMLLQARLRLPSRIRTMAAGSRPARRGSRRQNPLLQYWLLGGSVVTGGTGLDRVPHLAEAALGMPRPLIPAETVSVCPVTMSLG